MPRRIRLTGHALMFEGAAHDDQGCRCSAGTFLLKTTGVGRGKCSCGEMSEPLPNAAARKRWHRAHKLTLLSTHPTPTPATTRGTNEGDCA